MYDVIILGAGPAGYSAAIRAGQLGMKTALIDSGPVGGMCVNWGCIPVITMMESVRRLKAVKTSAAFGVTVTGGEKAALDWEGIKLRIREVGNRVRQSILSLLDRYSVERIEALAEVNGTGWVAAGGRTLESESIIIATGSLMEPLTAERFPGTPAGKISVLELQDLFSLDRLPERIAVWGGSAAALELSQFFGVSGIKTTLITESEALFSGMDGDIREAVKLNLSAAGVVFSAAADTRPEKGGPLLVLNCGHRRPVIPVIKCDIATENGFIRVDDSHATSAPGIYAAGDVTGKLMFSHAASSQGYAAVNGIAGIKRDAPLPKPFSLYTSPEAAQIGLTEEDCAGLRLPFKSARYMFEGNARAIAGGQEDGFLKVLYNRNCGEVYGIHIFAENASDLIAEAAVHLQYEGTVFDLARTVHAHPAISEIFSDLGKRT